MSSKKKIIFFISMVSLLIREHASKKSILLKWLVRFSDFSNMVVTSAQACKWFMIIPREDVISRIKSSIKEPK